MCGDRGNVVLVKPIGCVIDDRDSELVLSMLEVSLLYPNGKVVKVVVDWGNVYSAFE